MLRLVIASVIVVASAALWAAAVPHPPTTTAASLVAARAAYDTRFDNIDVDEILGQQRLLQNYIKCLEGSGACTPDGRMLKETLPDAIASDCTKCSARQKYSSDKVTRYLIDNRANDWLRLEKIYDPEGTYRKKYLAAKVLANTSDSSISTNINTNTTEANAAA